MWPSSVRNGIHTMKPEIPSESTLDDDLQSIDFSLYGDQRAAEKSNTDHKQYKHSIYTRNEMTVAILAQIKANELSYIERLPLNKTENQQIKVTTDHHDSIRQITEDSSLLNKPSVFHFESHETIRIVEITRTKCEPLGFFIRQGDGLENKNGIFVSRISRGSLVENGNLLRVGDEILEVNQVAVRGFSLSHIVKLIQLPQRLLLTLRITNTQQQLRPKVSSRHSSPSLLSGLDRELKAKHSNVDRYRQQNDEQKTKQRDEFTDYSNANESSSDLSKNTSTMDDLILLLRAQNRGRKDEHYCEIDGVQRSTKALTEISRDNQHCKRVDIDCNYDSISSEGDKNTLLRRQTEAPQRHHTQASTLTPATTVNVVFDDDTARPSRDRVAQRHPYHRSVIKPAGSSAHDQIPPKVTTLRVASPARSRSSSRGSSPGSPITRRQLPSIPVERDRKQIGNESIAPKNKLLVVPGNELGKTHRKLPTPPASPRIDQKSFVSQDQKTLGCSSNHSNKNSKSTSESHADQTMETRTIPQREHAEKNTQEKVKQPDKRPTYRRSQSEYGDFFEQQRHSMFLQTYAWNKPNTSTSSSATSTKTTSVEIKNQVDSPVEDFSNSLPRERLHSEVARERDAPTAKHRFYRGFSPAMRRHASSSLLTLKHKKETKDVIGSCQIKVESQPGFLVYPDDYSDDDLLCSHAVSGMMTVRVLKATNIGLADKKKKKKIYCAVEVDFERKAFTSSKKASKNPNWDEVFDIEIQHGREMCFMCLSSNKEFDRPVARASFYLTPLVRRGQAHQMIIRLKPEGFLHAELEFTELKTLLKRIPSDKQTGVFGFNLSVTSELEQSSVPHVVRKCVQEIEKRGLHVVGLYRISGNAKRKNQLRALFDEDSNAVDISAANCPDINVITGILKDYLRELPEPLITDRMSQDLILGVQDGIQEKDPEIERKFLSKLFSELPVTNRNTLVYIMNHLCRVVNNDGNKMDCRNLAVCLAPVLQCSPKNLSESKDLLNLKMYLKTVELLLGMWNRLGGCVV